MQMKVKRVRVIYGLQEEEWSRRVEWLTNVKNDIKDNEQGEIEITSHMVTI